MPRRDANRRKYLHEQRQKRQCIRLGITESQLPGSSNSRGGDSGIETTGGILTGQDSGIETTEGILTGQDSGIATAGESFDGDAGHGTINDDMVVEENFGTSSTGARSTGGIGSAPNARKRKSLGNAAVGKKRGRKRAPDVNAAEQQASEQCDNDGDENRSAENPFEAEYRKRADEFMKSIRQSCTYVCICCGNCWFRKSVQVFDADSYRQKYGPDLSAKIVCYPESTYICKTCNGSVKRGGTPKMCLSNGLSFPDIPEALRKLTDLEARLYALRLPFLQLRRLGWLNSSFRIKSKHQKSWSKEGLFLSIKEILHQNRLKNGRDIVYTLHKS